MIIAHAPDNGLLKRQELARGEAPPPGAIWLDLFEPDEEERRRIEAALAIALMIVAAVVPYLHFKRCGWL
jgi:Mg2+ and Co2+ transporter CorA